MLIVVRPDPSAPTPSAQLIDRTNRVLGSVRREGGRWQSAREDAPLGGGYEPST